LPSILEQPIKGQILGSARQMGAKHYYSWVALIVVIALGVAWLAGPILLRRAAHLWVVSDKIAPADAIILLGGRLDLRPAAAAELYKRGIAPRVAVGFSEFDNGQNASPQS
jgi:hypothetical protein